jgi:hypothetical protein
MIWIPTRFVACALTKVWSLFVKAAISGDGALAIIISRLVCFAKHSVPSNLPLLFAVK